MVRTRGLNHLHLLVADVERSQRFYEQAFGMKELFREGPDMVFVGIPGTDHVVTLHRSEEPIEKRGGIDHFGFQLESPEELSTAIAEVERAGGTLIRQGEHAPGAPYAYFADPDGHVFEL
jgi:Lactoylglutathione lyase and related lyases